MASDVVHTTAVIDAVLSALAGGDGADHTGGLPANWFMDARDADEVPLKWIEHGDLTDYPWDEPGWLGDNTPIIIVRSLALTPASVAAYGGLNGALGVEERMRLVHVRKHEQCRDDAGAVERNMTRARARYAKAIHQALFADQPWQKLAVLTDTTRTEPTITGALLIEAQWRGWDFGTGERGTSDVLNIASLRQPYWAIACDFSVILQTGGPS